MGRTDLLARLNDFEVERQRQAAEIAALKAAVASTQRAYLQVKARQASAAPIDVEPTWPE